MKKSQLVTLLLIVLTGAVFWWVGGLREERSGSLTQKAPSDSKPKDSKTISSVIEPMKEAPPPQVTTSVTPGVIMTPEPPAVAKVPDDPPPTSPGGSTSPPVAAMSPNSVRPPGSAPDELEGAKNEAESLALNIRQYRLRFGGNPVGTNAEIVKELDGGNPKTARYLPTELKRLNEKGELVDTWGTPYFFHQLSAEEMETRSAGPDKILWTTDDMVSK
jgi:hypothetical protein